MLAHLLNGILFLFCLGWASTTVRSEGFPIDSSEIPAQTVDQSGRSELLWSSTLWSFAYYGTAVSTAFSDGNAQTTTGAYMVMGSAGFLVPYFLTRNAEVPLGASTLAMGGMFQGALHGWMLGGLLFGDDLGNRTGWAMSAAVGITETVAAFLIAKHHRLGGGEASIVNSTMLLGTAFGALASVDFISQNSSTATDVRLLTGLGFVGAAGGVVVANFIRNSTSVNSADAAVFTTVATIGAFTPMAGVLAFSDRVDGTAFRLLTMAGIGAGVLGGYLMIDGRDYPNDNAIYYPLGAVAGSTFGLGVGLMLGLDRPIPVMMIAGAIAGLGVVLASEVVVNEARKIGSLEFNVNPLGLLVSMRSNVPVPVANLQVRF